MIIFVVLKIIIYSFRNRGMIDGAFLKEMHALKHEIPIEFMKNIAEKFHFNAVQTMNFRAELEKLN